MDDVCVVGAGAAGMMAAGFAARRGLKTVVLEKNARPGRKLMITGKGRCNLTNNCGTAAEFLKNVPVNPRFLYGVLARFGPEETMRFFEQELCVPLKTERGRRVFPVSDKAVDVVDALHGFVRKSGCRMVHGRAAGLLIENGRLGGVRLENGEKIHARNVVLCTGGKSYPLTGSTGDGYALAEQAGHRIIPLKPSLVPIVTNEAWVKEAQGLSLRNVSLTVEDTVSRHSLFQETGEMLFTHFGISGPMALSASSHIRDENFDRYRLFIDLKPGLTVEKLDTRILRDFEENHGKNYENSLKALLPSSLIPVIVGLCGIPVGTRTSQVTREQRRCLALLLKRLELTIRSFRPIEEAIITSGGVDVKEINPKTMESKKLSGLFFAGEIIDCDAYTGGFNLQIAFSTGFAAGNSVPAENG